MSIDRPSLSDLADEFQGLIPRLPFMHYAVFNWLPRQTFPVSTVTIIRNHFPCPRWPNKKPRQPALHAASCRSPDCFLCGRRLGASNSVAGAISQKLKRFLRETRPRLPAHRSSAFRPVPDNREVSKGSLRVPKHSSSAASRLSLFRRASSAR